MRNLIDKASGTSADGLGPVMPPRTNLSGDPCKPLEGLHQTPNANLPDRIVADLRTDHAGESGAVCIYQGILRFAKDTALRDFAQHHLVTEQNHLRLIETWLPRAHYSHLLPLWRLAGFLTGALPALMGSRAVYATIHAVETFVDQHYDEQVRAMAAEPRLGALRQALMDCQADEVAHRDEAATAFGADSPGTLLRAWCALVDFGSRAAVALCRHI